MQTPEWYQRDVSRETSDKLTAYADLLRKWTKKINLVSKSSVDDLEHRHIWDSAQIYEPFEGEWLDFGSGGGLPAIVIAILAQGEGLKPTMTLMESDQRKATFLRACARELALPLNIVVSRIENVQPTEATVISARALADLDHLLELSAEHLATDGQCLFMKGASWQQEVDAARENWSFSCDARQSHTNPLAAILRIKEIERV